MDDDNLKIEKSQNRVINNSMGRDISNSGPNTDDDRNSAVQDLQNLLLKKQLMKQTADEYAKANMALEEKSLMRRISRIERRNSELDIGENPMSNIRLSWTLFNTNMCSIDRDKTEVADLAKKNQNERVDVRPYMIHSPYTCATTDRIQKVLDIFRHF